MLVVLGFANEGCYHFQYTVVMRVSDIEGVFSRKRSARSFRRGLQTHHKRYHQNTAVLSKERDSWDALVRKVISNIYLHAIDFRPLLGKQAEAWWVLVFSSQAFCCIWVSRRAARSFHSQVRHTRLPRLSRNARNMRLDMYSSSLPLLRCPRGRQWPFAASPYSVTRGELLTHGRCC